MTPTLVASGQWKVDVDFAILNTTAETLAALICQRPASLKIWTEQPFNLWDNSDNPLSLFTQTVNASPTAKTLTLNWWARNYNGTVVAQGTTSSYLEVGQVWNNTLTFPAPNRGLLFVEVSVTDGANSVFARTNLSVLPPYSFASGTESIFGLNGGFHLPTVASEQALLQRMGVRWLRSPVYSVGINLGD